MTPLSLTPSIIANPTLKEIIVRLDDSPHKINDLGLTILRLDDDARKLKAARTEYRAAVLLAINDELQSAGTKTNEAQREGLLLKRLAEDSQWVKSSMQLEEVEAKLGVARVDIEREHGIFRAAVAIAGLIAPEDSNLQVKNVL